MSHNDWRGRTWRHVRGLPPWFKDTRFLRGNHHKLNCAVLAWFNRKPAETQQFEMEDVILSELDAWLMLTTERINLRTTTVLRCWSSNLCGNFDILISCFATYLASILFIIYGRNISQLRWNFAWEFHPNGEFPRVRSTWNIKVASFISIFMR